MIKYFCDNARHLVCVPYTVDNLHAMAHDLNIDQCWYHARAKYPHYDVPLRRMSDIALRCTVVSSRDIIAIVKGEHNVDTEHHVPVSII